MPGTQPGGVGEALALVFLKRGEGGFQTSHEDPGLLTGLGQGWGSGVALGPGPCWSFL